MPKIVDHKLRRAEIAEATARLIAAGGMEAATIREIARASGYSKGIIEHYFVDKNELIDAALGWANECYYQREAKATKDLRGLAALRARLEATVPASEATRTEWRVRLVSWAAAAIHPPLGERQAIRGQQAVKHFAADITAAVELGEIQPGVEAEPQARSVFHSVSGLSCALLHNPGAYPRALIQQEIDNIVAHIGHTCR